MNLLLLTSTSLRHRYLAHQLSEHFELELVIAEAKSEKIEATSTLPEEDAEFMARHFQLRADSEREFFGVFEHFPEEVPLLELPHGEINALATSELIENIAPDFIVLFGSSILKNSLMDSYKGRIINLHLGLSPYYTGSATNLFPYYYNDPESIGATIHLASEKVDEGAILHQLRPDMEVGDDLHQIGNRVIQEAGKQLPEVLKKYEGGQLTPQLQQPPGRICRNKDLTPQLLREIYRKFDQGLIREYLHEKEQRDLTRNIVNGLK